MPWQQTATCMITKRFTGPAIYTVIGTSIPANRAKKFISRHPLRLCGLCIWCIIRWALRWQSTDWKNPTQESINKDDYNKAPEYGHNRLYSGVSFACAGSKCDWHVIDSRHTPSAFLRFIADLFAINISNTAQCFQNTATRFHDLFCIQTFYETFRVVPFHINLLGVSKKFFKLPVLCLSDAQCLSVISNMRLHLQSLPKTNPQSNAELQYNKPFLPLFLQSIFSLQFCQQAAFLQIQTHPYQCKGLRWYHHQGISFL